MGRISDEDIQRVREATDVVAVVADRVVLRQKGRLFWGCCPFHQEKTPSFKVDPATQLWHCFGCGAGGDAFGFLMRSENLEFPEAVRMLAERARIDIVETEGGVPRSHKERLAAASEAAAEFYHRILVAGRDAGVSGARDYLAQRGFGIDVAKRWRLGWSPGHGQLAKHLSSEGFTGDELVAANLAFRAEGGQLRDRFYGRVMFPIHDVQGRTIAFGGRIVGQGEPKYLNTQETPIFSKGRNLYAIEVAKAEIVSSGSAVVVEGYTDVIALHETGVRNVVATLGTALTRDHLRLLGRFARRIVYLFDGDAAGLRAADRAVEFVDRSITPEAGRDRIELFVAVLPGGADPADFVAGEGAERMREVLAGAQPLLRFAIDRRLSGFDLSQPEPRARALAAAAAVLAPVKDSTLAGDYANYIADRLQAGAGSGLAVVDTEAVLRAVRAARVQPQPAGDDATGQPGAELATAPSAEVRTERDAIGLLAANPALRVRARNLLEGNLLTDPTARRLAETLLDAPGEPAASVSARLEAVDPIAAAVLAGAVMVEADGSAEDAFDEIEGRLRELDLERRIAAGKARLKRREGFADDAEYDDVFRQVSLLQRELEALRRSTRSQ